MNRITRIMDAVEEGASGFIRLAYLAAGVLAVASYFGDGQLPPLVVAIASAVLPWVLSAAMEVHSYITARRVRAAWQGIQGSARGTEEHRVAVGAMKVNLGILTGLLAFSVLNQWQYLGSTWTPPTGAYALPVWAAIGLRAVIVPLAFLAAAFLVPVGESLAARIKAESHHYAGEVFGVARRQWREKLDEMRREKKDVTAALVSLIEDENERHAIEVVHSAMFGGVSARLQAGTGRIDETRKDDGPRYPTGGTPQAQPARRPHRRREPVLRLTPAPEETNESKARKALAKNPNLSKSELARIVGCSPSTAARLKAKIQTQQPMPIAG